MNAPTYARLGLLLALVCGSSAAGPLIGGPARVVDGDTLEMAGEYVRLAGIDAPEAAQWCHVEQRPWHCGRQAATALHQWIAGAPVQCYVSTYDRYGRAVGARTGAAPTKNPGGGRGGGGR
ncbi:MAG: thermonuclease family protein, partial [Salinisphaera sp.]|nr:thermonuclease family protein [Salinisphaera sp.]